MNDYQAKFVAPEQAVKAVQSGDWVTTASVRVFPSFWTRPSPRAWVK